MRRLFIIGAIALTTVLGGPVAAASADRPTRPHPVFESTCERDGALIFVATTFGPPGPDVGHLQRSCHEAGGKLRRTKLKSN